MTGQTLLTVAQAATRVKRKQRTIERWIAAGELKVEWWSNVRMVRIDDLLAVYRAKLQNAHHQSTPEQVARHLADKYLPIESTHRRD